MLLLFFILLRTCHLFSFCCFNSELYCKSKGWCNY